MWGVFKEGKKCIFRGKYSSFFICQPSTWPSAATAAARAKAPTWCTPAWATANPAPSPPGTRCWWPPTSPTTSRRPRAAAPSAGTPRWESPTPLEACGKRGRGSGPVSQFYVSLQVKVRLDCPRGRHHDEIEILTAKACRCDMCRKSRYWYPGDASAAILWFSYFLYRALRRRHFTVTQRGESEEELLLR